MLIGGKWVPAANSKNFGFHCWSAKAEGTVCELECMLQRKTTPEKVLDTLPLIFVALINMKKPPTLKTHCFFRCF